MYAVYSYRIYGTVIFTVWKTVVGYAEDRGPPGETEYPVSESVFMFKSRSKPNKFNDIMLL